MLTHKPFKTFLTSARLVTVLLLAVAVVGGAAVHADQFDEQIKRLQAENNSAQTAVNGLAAQAGGYQAAINQLQAQINAVEAALAQNQAQQAAIQAQIEEAQKRLDQQKAFLSDDIKTMYIDGQLSTIEELATSKNLSEYVDREEYRTRVQNKIDATIKEIAALQVELQKKKAELDLIIKSEQDQQGQLADARGQQQELLNYNESQQSAYNQKIASNQGRIAELRRQQIAANSRFIGGGGGAACGGGYPGVWCNAPQDSMIDNWGMYNRECVSYTAFKVAASGRYMPYWGGRGNANQWDDNARAAGIPVDYSPQPGDVAISNSGFYGHAMYVEGVNGDGTINISQYNAGLNGLYSTRSGMSTAGLVFIHFP